ncbi:sec-independent translocase [Streptomyces sp. NPDC091292]|uniref:sec-independent translocase n=1 Tax=Streptomyces sp. NPDC091292 TaxID=3365991 RepID=UPI0038174519
MFSDVGIMEVITLVVLGLLLFGPDKLPEQIQNLTRMIRKVREFSESAKQEIRSELGPEFKDFEFEDLHPKTFVRKHVLEGKDGDGFGLDEIRKALDPREELAELADAVRGLDAGDGESEDVRGTEPVREQAGGGLPPRVVLTKDADSAPASARVPFDPDAT